MVKTGFLIILFSFILSSVCSGLNQDCYHFSSISKGENLYSGSLDGLLKDSNDYIYYHSQGSIFKFDGRDWEKIGIPTKGKRSTEQLIINGSLKEDNHGNLWLGNSVGLFYYGSQTGEIKALSDLYPEIEIFSESISNVLVYSDNKIFFIVNREPYMLQYNFVQEGSELVNLSVSKVLQESSPEYFLMDLSPDGKIWIFANEHAMQYNPIENQVKEVHFSRNLRLDANFVFPAVINISDKGIIWIGTQNFGINSYNIKTGELKHYPTVEGQKIRMVRDIEEDKLGNIWACTSAGLIRIQLDGQQPYMKLIGWGKEVESLYLQYVTSMFAADDGYLLLGTNGGQIIKLENCEELFNFLPINKGFNVAPVYSVNATTRNTPDGEVIKVRNHKQASKIVSIHYNDEKEKDYITYSVPGDMIRDFEFIDGQLWVGSAKTGFAIYDPQTKKETLHPELRELIAYFKRYLIARIVKCFGPNVYLITQEGDTYYLSKSSDGVWEWQQKSYKFKRLTIFASPFLSTTDGWVWTANPLTTLVGLGPNGEIRTFPIDGGKRICSLGEGPENSLFVGLYNGLLKINKATGQMTSFDDFNDVSVFNIIKEDNNVFWINSYQKLFRFNYQSGKVDIISNKNGLPDCRFQANSAIRFKNGDLGIGTLRKGVMHFPPKAVRFDSKLLTVKIIGVKVNGDNVIYNSGKEQFPLLDAQYPHARKVKLQHFHKLVSIHFSALDYLYGHNIQYSYLLDGVDENWNIVGVGVNEVTYNNMSPGRYTFRVKATETPGVWDGEETTMLIDIRPAWYQTTWAKVLFLLTLGCLISFFWWYSIGKVRLKEQLKLEKAKRDKEKEINKMKLQFFTNISHEFKTPLSLLFGPLKQLRAEGAELSIEEREGLFELMSRNIRHLMDMINQLMDFRKVENKAMKLRVRPTNISRFIEDEFNHFKSDADSQMKTFILETEIEEPVFGWVDSEKLSRILSNLLSNAIKYTSIDGIIRLNYIIKENGVELNVCDNGAGIDKKHLPHIFERYYRVDEDVSLNQQVPGTGIGLALCSDLADLMKGEITVDSTPGKGTCFRFWFPISASSFKSEEKEEEAIAKKQSPPLEKQAGLTIDSSDAKRDKPLLLIVEDNLDMQAFLEGILKNRYILKFANNGFEGIDKCDKLAPDLVVSDVMMPEMDGFEMVKRLKTDVRISHIPIILLTALSSPEHRVEGVQAGADLYIQKPFDPEFLRISINNLIESRKKLRAQFGEKLIDIKTSEIAITKTDEVFLDKIMKIIEERLFDSEFKIEDIHSEVGMSRSQFFRKIKALTDQTAGEFVKSLRLKKAAELLTREKIRISDVCYEVGFTDPKYFGKVFRKHFGMSPSDFMKSKQ